MLIAEPNLPRNQWSVGRVRDVNLSWDGRVRSCRVNTATTELVRPIVKLCLLEQAQ